MTFDEMIEHGVVVWRDGGWHVADDERLPPKRESDWRREGDTVVFQHHSGATWEV